MSSSTPSAFNSIPLIDLSLANDPGTKPALLESLRHALLDIGFLYITNFGIDDALIQDVIREGKAFFELPEEKKLEIEMKNQKSFLGYSRLGNETTKHATDWREQLDLSTPHPLPSPSAPAFHNLLAPNQWPDPNYLPTFRPTYEKYIEQMGVMSSRFVGLISEAIGLPRDIFDRFIGASAESSSQDPITTIKDEKDEKEKVQQIHQHKLKIVKYPDTSTLGRADDDDSEVQGVGPHKDSMLTSYLLQASEHRGLQVLNGEGRWIDVPPVKGTLVVAIGQALEALTFGVCQSTTHRVLSPRAHTGPRYSIPFFQGISYTATFSQLPIPNDAPFHALLAANKASKRKDFGATANDFAGKGWQGCLGEATLANRVRSHVDVGERWYPELLMELRRGDEERRRGEEEVRV